MCMCVCVCMYHKLLYTRMCYFVDLKGASSTFSQGWHSNI